MRQRAITLGMATMLRRKCKSEQKMSLNNTDRLKTLHLEAFISLMQTADKMMRKIRDC